MRLGVWHSKRGLSRKGCARKTQAAAARRRSRPLGNRRRDRRPNRVLRAEFHRATAVPDASSASGRFGTGNPFEKTGNTGHVGRRRQASANVGSGRFELTWPPASLRRGAGCSSARGGEWNESPGSRKVAKDTFHKVAEQPQSGSFQ